MFPYINNERGNVVAYLLIVAALMIIVAYFSPIYQNMVDEGVDEQTSEIGSGLGIDEEIDIVYNPSELETGTRDLTASISMSPLRPRVTEDDSVSFSASASGGQGPYSVEWENYDGGNSVIGSFGSSIYYDEGGHTVRARVTDSEGNTSVASRSFTVYNPVDFDIVTKNEDGEEVSPPFVTGDHIEVEAGVDNIDADTCNWVINGEQISNDCGPHVIDTDTAETISMRLQVCDTNGNCDETEESIRIEERPIEVEVLAYPDRNEIYQRESMRFALDATGGSGEYSIYWLEHYSGPSELNEFGEERYYDRGQVVIEAQVCDDVSGTTPCGTGRYTLDIINEPPTRPTLDADPDPENNEIYRNTDMTFEASGSIDRDGDDFHYEYRVNDGSWSQTPPDGRFEPNSGGYTIYARAVDELGDAGPEDYVQFEIGNRPPTEPNLEITPTRFNDTSNEITRYDDIGFRAYGSEDPDGDTFTYQYRLDGGSWTNEIATNSYDPGDYTVEARSVDEWGLASDSTSLDFRVENEPPELRDIYYTPDPAKSEDTISFHADVHDPEGDSFEVYWNFDDQGYENSPPDGRYPRGEYTVSAYAVDALGAQSETLEIEVEINNTPPTTPNLDVSPGNVGTPTTRFEAEAYGSTDFDADPITYQYRINGGSWISYSIPRTFSEGNHLIQARAVDSHGGTSGIVSETITVDTSPPTDPYLNIYNASGGSTWNATDEDLICISTGGSTDPDGGGVRYDTNFPGTHYCTTLPPGTHTFNSTAVDDFGNRSNTVYRTITIERSFFPVERTFNYTGGDQTFFVPADGTYRFTVRGAQGGGRWGGLGAEMRGDFSLNEGDRLTMGVGGSGNVSSGSATGGGASYIRYNNGAPLIVAGGGGGNATTSWLRFRSHAVTSANAQDGISDRTSASGGSGGNGGSTSHSSVGSGAGYYTSGNYSYNLHRHGIRTYYQSINGGAGGGGAIRTVIWNRAGGGGGWSGGGGVRSNSSTGWAVGGGGGSYNNGSNQQNRTQISYYNGAIEVERLD